MTEPNPGSRRRDVDAQRVSDNTGDTECGCASSSHSNTDGQHASADVAPELFGW